MGGGKKVVVEPPRHAGVFIARGKEDALVTKNMVMGESVYGEKRIAVEDETGKIEYERICLSLVAEILFEPTDEPRVFFCLFFQIKWQ